METSTFVKDNSTRRQQIVAEIVSTEQTYVQGLSELVDIYVQPAHQSVSGSCSGCVIPPEEHRAVFGNIETLLQFHSSVFLPVLMKAAEPVLQHSAAVDSELSDVETAAVAESVAIVFSMHAAFFKMYSSYINNCDLAQAHIAGWTRSSSSMKPNLRRVWSQDALRAVRNKSAPSRTLGRSQMAAVAESKLTAAQKKRINHFLQRCRSHANHSQLNLEAYLLLPVQRIPRYKLLLEELTRSTDPLKLQDQHALTRALLHISHIASSVNRSKHQHEQSQRLLAWQYRIQASIEGSLVQPHRHLLKDGTVKFQEVERRSLDSSDDSFNLKQVQAPDSPNISMNRLQTTPKDLSMFLVLCNDVAILCLDAAKGKDPHGSVRLHAIIKLVRPADVVDDVYLRLTDKVGTISLSVSTPKEAEQWKTAFDTHFYH